MKRRVDYVTLDGERVEIDEKSAVLELRTMDGKKELSVVRIHWLQDERGAK